MERNKDFGDQSAQSDFTTKKEGISSVKLQSVWSLLFGQRASQFDAFLQTVPTSNELSWLSLQLKKPDIDSVIFDIDGTLVAPYAEIRQQVIDLLGEYMNEGRKVGVYTNSPHTDRLNAFRDAGIAIAETGIGKPYLEGFQRFCDVEKMDPKSTAMIGNFPITDMPYVPEGEEPFFPMNILVESIPPRRELIPSFSKYIRAQLFNTLNLASARVVLARNPGIYRG